MGTQNTGSPATFRSASCQLNAPLRLDDAGEGGAHEHCRPPRGGAGCGGRATWMDAGERELQGKDYGGWEVRAV